MNKKIIICLGIVFVIINFINSICFASVGSFSLSKTSTTINEGGTDTFTISIKNCEGKFTVSSSDTSIATVNMTSEWLSENKVVTITAKKEGTAKITVDPTNVSGTDEQDVEGAKVITVTVKGKNSVTPTVTPSPKLSSDATLTNLGINPYDFSGFDKNKETYNVTVPKETSSINIYANKRTGQTVTGLGSKNLNIGSNTFKVIVTAEDKKTTKTYTLNITRESISKVATLKNLGIRPNDFKGFKSGTLSYNVKVPYDVEKINIYAEKTNAASTVTGLGDKTLDVGANTFKVVVTAEDKKTTRTYTLIVNRLKENEESNEETKEEPEENDEEKTDGDVKGLTSIEIAGFTLKPEFKNDVYEYTLEATDEAQKLDIQTKTSSDKIKVEIIGNEKLEIGENLITLLVRNEDGTKTTYQINVDTKATPVDVTELNNELKDAQNKVKAQKIIVIAVIAIIVFLIIVFFVEKYKIQRNEDDGEYFDEEDYEENDTDEEIQENDRNVEVNESQEQEEIDERFEEIKERLENETYDDFDDIKQKRWNARGKRYK